MRFLIRFFLLSCLVLAIVTAVFFRWAGQPLVMHQGSVDFRITPGSSLRTAIQTMSAAGIEMDPRLFALLARVRGQSSAIRAGSYSAAQGETPESLLVKLATGKVSQSDITLVEGWTFQQFRSRMDVHPELIHDSRGLSDAEIIERLGLPWKNLEGRLFPDTYLFDKQSGELELIARAVRVMQDKLDALWQQRPAGLPYHGPDDALIMASIIEKETGAEQDRQMVAAVFINRLRIGMRLQTDPTVIYGLGTHFDGNLRRSDLSRDTPYNTYTRAGLPPTPIAMPGLSSLHAAFTPAASDVLYFVARGDGSSQFSRTLGEHNQAVNRYQRGRR